jgi:dCTP diphosphatase
MSKGKSKGDHETTVQELKDLIIRFSEDRNWGRHHTPKNLAASITIEAAELLEHFQWDEYQKNDREAIAGELADILAYLLNFAHVMDIDIAQAFRKKMKAIGKKYPVETFNMEKVSKEEFFRIKEQYRRQGDA